MNIIIKKAIKKISGINLDITRHYKTERIFNNITHVHFLKSLYKSIDTYLYINSQIPIRIYTPNSEYKKLIIYFHGGGWIAGNINSYDKVCSILSTTTNCMVVSVDYPLAPESPFPNAINTCYDVVKHFCSKNNILDVKSENIILMGDSAGGNMAAVLSLMARDNKQFKIKKQVLIYPLTYHDHTANSPFDSVNENGKDYILTCEKINQYMEMYIGNNDIKNPYITPLNAKKLKHQPKTLIITAEFDPLRDEGEEYGRKLIQAGNKAKIVRINDVIHGFFSFPIVSEATKKTYEMINKFIGDENEK